jgi:hypothetical protein
MRLVPLAVLVLAASLAPGCAAAKEVRAAPVAAADVEAASRAITSAVSERLLVKRASLRLEVDDPAEVAPAATRIAKEAGGWVESSSATSDRSAYLTLRVPARSLDAVLESLEKLGDVEERSVTTEDVTEQTIDLDARLQNLVAVRDRVKKHLDLTLGVKDVLEVEKELAKLQSEIDSLHGRLKFLRGQAAMSAVTLWASRPRILGPIGYVGYGLWWGISKLFVIR